MKKPIILSILTVMLIYSLSSSYAFADMTAQEIVNRSDDLMRGKTAKSKQSMTIVNPNWTRTITMKTWSRGDKDFFIHILSPPREEGTTFLKQDKLLYQYMPSAEMRIKISPSMMLQSWMGSDFTNDDLVKESSLKNDYTHKILGKETINGVECYKIESLPKPDAPVVWGKLINWFGVKDYVPRREEFFDEKGVKIKVMTFSDVKMANDRLFPYKMEMVPLNKEGHKTSLQYETIEFNVNVSDSIFTLKNLEKPRAD